MIVARVCQHQVIVARVCQRQVIVARVSASSDSGTCMGQTLWQKQEI